MTARWTAGTNREVLANGLTLLVQRIDSAPAVAVVTHVKAGFFDEPDHWGGISHVLEHMFFKGTPTRAVGAIARETKAAGGYLNAGTGYDHTSYYTVLPASGLGTALDIQSDALRNSLIDAEELRRELKVIVQEAKRKLDSPSAVAVETLHHVMYDRHRIRRWRIGSEEMLAGFTRDDLMGYYRSRYVPSRTIVAIVGAIDETEALDLARQRYADWPVVAPRIDPSVEEPDRHELRARTLRGDIAQAELVLGWRAVGPLHPDAPALDLAAAVLAAGRASWLHRALRETGVVTSISAYNFCPTELGLFVCSADLDPARLEESLRGIAREIQRLGDQGPTSEDLERARTLLVARWARRLESMEGRASDLASAEALRDFTWLDTEYEAMLAVSTSDVQSVVRRYFEPSRVSAVAYLPHGRGEDLTPARLQTYFTKPAESRPPQFVSVPTVARSTPLRVAGELVAEVLHVALPGVDLLVRRKKGVPTVTLGAYRLREHFEVFERAGLGALAVRSAVRGAGPFDAVQLAFAFERLGGVLAPVISADWFGFGATVLAEHVEPAALLLRTVMGEPTFPDPAIAVERGALIEEVAQVADDMLRYPFQLAMGAAFGDRTYGVPLSGTIESLSTLTPEDVRTWQRSESGQGRVTVIAVGEIDPARVAEQLAGVFHDLPAAEAAARGPSRSTSLIPEHRGRERTKAQSAFAMVFPGPSRIAPERHAAQVWAAIASGLGGRLFEALRDRRSLAYTVMASAWQRHHAGALLTYIATSPEREGEAREAMLTELDNFRRRPVEQHELDQAVSYLSGQALVSRQSAGSLAGEILDSWLAGAGLVELADPTAGFRSVTIDQILELSGRCLDPGMRAEGIVRGGGGSAPTA